MKEIPVLPQNVADSYAIQALFMGKATEAQQIRAVKCIVEEISGAYERSFYPGDPYQTAFNEGKRHVGRALVGIAKLKLEAVKQADGRIQERVKTKLTIKTKGNPNG